MHIQISTQLVPSYGNSNDPSQDRHFHDSLAGAQLGRPQKIFTYPLCFPDNIGTDESIPKAIAL